MNFHYIKHNVIILLCTLLLINGCNKENKKIIVENKEIPETTKILKTVNPAEKFSKQNKTDKVLKKELKSNDTVMKRKLSNNDVVFEFRNERLLQGRNINTNLDNKKTKLALSAVQNMFKKNLSSNIVDLNLKNNDNISTLSRYIFETNEDLNYKNIIVFLPLTGKYSNFGKKIRKSLDLSILNFGNNRTKIIYFDTGKNLDEKVIKSLFDKLNPSFVIGPFTREILLKIKPFAKEKILPILTFSNDIAMVEKNVWSLGFSPEEQVESVISCALISGYKKFGIIAPDNLYGKIISRHSKELVSVDKNNFYDSIFLSNEQINNKNNLYSILRKFLQYSKTEETHTKFDTILIGGRKEFILEIAPLLAFFNVDSRYIKILGTETFNDKEIKNEPSLEKSWFPIISSKNDDEFKFLWKEIWGGNNNYFTNAGYDSGIIGLNYLNNMGNTKENLNNVQGQVTGLILGSNGYVKKPIQVMQIEDLGKLTNIKKCSKFRY